MSSSPPSAARKEIPPVLRSTSFTVSRLRSLMTFSVTTVTDWGMSRSSWLPLPMEECVARTESLPWGASAASLMVTVPSVFSCGAAWVCAQLPTDAASIRVPRGRAALREAMVGSIDAAMATCVCRCVFLPEERVDLAKMASKLSMPHAQVRAGCKKRLAIGLCAENTWRTSWDGSLAGRG